MKTAQKRSIAIYGRRELARKRRLRHVFKQRIILTINSVADRFTDRFTADSSVAIEIDTD